MSDLDELDTAAQPSEPTLPQANRIAFMYPTLGVTIYATDQKDADAQAAVHPLNPKNT
jgi:hypothetical protein